MPARSRSPEPTLPDCRRIAATSVLCFRTTRCSPTCRWRRMSVTAWCSAALPRPNRHPAALSGGQQQRVALARALAISPKLLLLDEPLSNLDAKLRETLRIELREILRVVGATTLVVTHDQTEAIALADRIALMNKGCIVQIGIAREIYQEPATRFVAEFIGQSIWFSGRLGQDAGRATFVTEDGIILPVTPPANLPPTVGLSIRPEHIHLPARPNDIGRVPATVTVIEFF